MSKASSAWRALLNQIKTPGWRKVLSAGLVLLSLGFMAYGIYSQWDTLRAFQWRIVWHRFALAFCFFPLGALPALYAWHLLITGFGASQPFSGNATAFALSCLPKRLPGMIWYISSRTLWYQERQVPAAIVLLATTWETLGLSISGLLTYGTITLACSLDSFLTWPLIVALSAGIALVIGLASPVWLKKVLTRLKREKWIQGVQSIRPAHLIAILAIYSFAWINGGIFFYFMVTSIYQAAPFWPLVSIWVGASTVGILSSIVQGMGLKELTMSVLLSTVMPLSLAITIAILARLVHTVAEALLMLCIPPLASLLTKKTPILPT
ncbi:MAG: flippase-like domain-containing protein [Anaerolineae bacterium]|nr:flippase-like domain-containing protein [Anaerolineae bacterium]